MSWKADRHWCRGLGAGPSPIVVPIVVLIAVLVFRPAGLLGESVSEESLVYKKDY